MDVNIAFSLIFVILSMRLVSVSALQHFCNDAVCFPTFDKHCSDDCQLPRPSVRGWTFFLVRSINIASFRCLVFSVQTVGSGGVTSNAPTQIVMTGIPPELAGRLKEGVAPPAQITNIGILDVASKLKVCL